MNRRGKGRCTLRQQAANNSKQQFSASPDLTPEVMNAAINHWMSTPPCTQVLNSPDVLRGVIDILLNQAGLYGRLRASISAPPG